MTGSRDEPLECTGVFLEGVAGPQQVGLRYDLVVQPATVTYDGRCVVETDNDDQDAFSVQIVPGTHQRHLCDHVLVVKITGVVVIFDSGC